MDTGKHSIRNLDKNLVLEARIYALQTGQTLGDVINASLEEFLAQVEDGEDWEQAA